MKIAIIARSTVLHFTSGGMETHLKNLAEGLRQSGHNVEIITTSLPYPDKIQTNDELIFGDGMEANEDLTNYKIKKLVIL